MTSTTAPAETTPLRVAGLHHVTAIASDPQRNHDFYVKTLGLRMVKQTVNFDDPGSYHLYYGDGLGAPGTAMTFFPWPGARRGEIGLGQSALTQFSVPEGTLGYWETRLVESGATFLTRETVFGQERIIGQDPDGLPFALVATADDPRSGWAEGAPGGERAIRGFHGVTLALDKAGPTLAVLTELLGYEQTDESEAPGGKVARLRAPGAAGVLDIHEAPGLRRGQDGAGVTHHIAFSVPNDEAHAEIRARVAKAGHNVTPVIDRNYFHSIYFRSPGGVLFEVATDNPGFDVDEPRDRLGQSLKLPPQYEHARDRIEAALPPLKV